MRSLASFLSWSLYIVGLLISLSPIGCWSYQGYIWLKKGVWVPLPVSRYVTVDQTGWLGLDQVIAFVVDMNIGYPVMVAGILLMTISLRIRTT